MSHTTEYAAANEFNGLVDPTTYHTAERVGMRLSELAAAGGRITRVRWLQEGGRSDLSYVHGELRDGTPVRIEGALVSFLVRSRMGALIEWAKAEGVYAKPLGLLDQANWSVLRG